MASVTQLNERNDKIRSALKDLQVEHDGEAFDEETKARWNGLNEELEANTNLITELEARRARLEELSASSRNTEAEPVRGAHFGTRRASAVPDDPTALEEYRVRAGSLDELERAYVDGAMRLIDSDYSPGLDGVSREEAQADVEKLLRNVKDREVALRVITTSSKRYKEEFLTYIRTQGRVAGQEMQRTASLTTTAGGYAVPVDLDTTLLLTNAGVANPIRQIARQRQTNVNTVEWINTAGITAGYGAEATEASDNAPTLAQPTANIEKAFAFVPMSIEIAEDWAAIQQDMAMCFADAKNQLESTKFLKGLGHGSHEPQGLIASGGATAMIKTATTAVFAVGDLFNVEAQLGPRYRDRASIVGNKATFQKVRQFASNGVNIWVQLPGNSVQPELIGYPVLEWSSYDSTPTTSNSTILTIGDFSYFAIVDRAGMNVEFLPHLFGGSNRYPTGQRGLYAWWRNSSQVLSPTVIANSAFQSLVVL
jgi:HK97 family phage major capsid protein